MANKSFRKCSACGEGMEADESFCTSCGRSYAQQQKDMKQCPSCDKHVKQDAAFCTHCGNSFGEKKQQTNTGVSPFSAQILNLANDFLSVREIAPGRFEFSSETGTQSPVQKVKIKYEAVAQLDEQKKQILFWEKMVESSAGMTAGVFAEKKVQKGIEVGKAIHGQLLFGGKYGFEYGKLRAVIKAIAAEQNWGFKTAILKPQQNTGINKTNNASSKKSFPLVKIGAPVLGFLLLALIVYFCSSGVSTLGTRSFQEQGTVAQGKPFVETDRNTYNYGDTIQVFFYNAPGYSRDWICIVPAGSPDTDAGSYKYLPAKTRGVVTFKTPQSGKYEVRAYYNYSAGRYLVSARSGFTVAKSSGR